MNIKKTINHFIKNFLFDLPSKLRKKIAEVVLLYFATAYKGRAIVFAVFPMSTKILSQSYESKWVWDFEISRR
ncbi:MAG: hypothetical protein ABDH28_07195 [Brevinematia bacterium]